MRLAIAVLVTTALLVPAALVATSAPGMAGVKATDISAAAKKKKKQQQKQKKQQNEENLKAAPTAPPKGQSTY